LIPGLEGVEFLPEPEDPRMLSTIDPDAPGYPAEAYGLSAELDPGGWKEAEAAKPFRAPLDLPWGLWILLIVIVGLLLTYSTLVTYMEDFIPNSEWAYESTHIRELNEAGLDGSGVRVCIVDTGVDISHPDLAGVNLVAFKDFINTGNSNPHDNDDQQSHGTMMVGILMANGSFRGAAPGVQLIVAAALDSEGTSGSEAAVADAIEWCWVEMGADIISLSLGGKPDLISTFGSSTESAVNSALDNGVFVVAAAGNHGGAGQDYPDVTVPANVAGVISVGATHRNGTLWSDSSAGSATNPDGTPRSWPNQKPEVVAPGVQIHSTFVSADIGATWSRSDGTSDSTVFVTGALALILERYKGNPNLKPVQEGDRSPIDLVKQALADSCELSAFQEDGSHHLRYGYGRLNAEEWSEQVGIRLAE
jgi:serine protease AprX